MISAFDSATGLPISSVMSVASSSARSVSSSNAFQRIAGAIVRGRTAPFLLGFHGRVERGHGVLGRPVGDLAERLLGRRVDHLERPAARGVAPLAADVELVLDLLDDLLFLSGDAHVATVSVPSSSDMATSIE